MGSNHVAVTQANICSRLDLEYYLAKLKCNDIACIRAMQRRIQHLKWSACENSYLFLQSDPS